MKRLISFLVVALAAALIFALPVGADNSIKVLTFQIYTGGQPSGTTYDGGGNKSGTTIPQPTPDSGSGWTGNSGASKWFTLTYKGRVSNAEDNRTVDMKDWAPNGIEKATLRLVHGQVCGTADTSGVSGPAIGTNYLMVFAYGCPDLTDTNSGVSWFNLNDQLSGVSRIDLFTVTAAGQTNYPLDVTSKLNTPAFRYYRFLATGVTTDRIPGSGTSQWPGSPAGTSWEKEVGPKLILTIVPKN